MDFNFKGHNFETFTNDYIYLILLKLVEFGISTKYVWFLREIKILNTFFNTRHYFMERKKFDSRTDGYQW